MSKIFQIYFPDHSFKVINADPNTTTTEDIWLNVSRSLQLSNYEMELFFLWVVTPEFEYLLYPDSLLADLHEEFKGVCDHYVDPEKLKDKRRKNNLKSKTLTKNALLRTVSTAFFNHVPSTFVNEFGEDEFRLYFKPTSIVPLAREMRCTSEIATRLFYGEAVSNVISGKYPLPATLACQLCAIDFHVKNGPYSAKTAKDLLENILNYLPDIHKYNKGDQHLTANEWTEKLSQYYQNLSTHGFNELQLMERYLKVCRRWPYYGSTFFKGKVLSESKFSTFRSPFEGSVFIAVNQLGIHIIDPNEMKSLSCTFSQIIGVDYPGEKMVVVKIKTTTPKPTLMGIKAAQADLITNCYDNWLDELDSIMKKIQRSATTTDFGSLINTERPTKEGEAPQTKKESGKKESGKKEKESSKRSQADDNKDAPKMNRPSFPASAKEGQTMNRFETRDLGVVVENAPIMGNKNIKLRQLDLKASYSFLNLFVDIEKGEVRPAAQAATLKKSESRDLLRKSDNTTTVPTTTTTTLKKSESRDTLKKSESREALKKSDNPETHKRRESSNKDSKKQHERHHHHRKSTKDGVELTTLVANEEQQEDEKERVEETSIKTNQPAASRLGMTEIVVSSSEDSD